jgi:methyl-accepting chemotaxis protein
MVSVQSRFRFNSLSGKMVALSLLPVALFLLFFSGYVLPTLHKAVLNAKQEGLRQLVDASLTLLQDQETQVQAGKVDLATAQARGRELFAVLRYDKSNYLWVQSQGPHIVIHPLHPDWTGKATDDLGNPALTRLFRDLEQAAKPAEGGFHAYKFSKPGVEGLYPKASYVRTFAPWGWTVGTGVYVEDVDRQVWSIALVMLAGILLVSVLVYLLAKTISRRMVQPLHQLVDGLKNSDLSKQIVVTVEDEVGGAARAFNDYNGAMRQTVLDVSQYADRAASGSHELAATAEQMSQAVDEIAQVSDALKNAGEQVFEALRGLGSNAGLVAAQTQEAETQSQDIVRETNRSAEAGRDTAAGMTDIKRVTDQIVSAVMVIQDIARQTNLLSLNAAIEAAKAGQQGKGFAVVAEEVRKLAERSGTAAREIEGLIQRTQAVVSGGVQSVDATLASLQAIHDRIVAMAKSIADIGGLSRQQASTGQNVADLMSQTTGRLSQNAATTHQLATTVHEIVRTSEELAGVAEGLRSVVKSFKL